MTIQFVRSGYQGTYQAGNIATLPPDTESALILGGWAINSAAVPNSSTAGSYRSGRAIIPAGSSSVVVTNPLVNAASSVTAAIAQAANDATLTSISRILPAAGSFTITGNANATAAVVVAWDLGN